MGCLLSPSGYFFTGEYDLTGISFLFLCCLLNVPLHFQSSWKLGSSGSLFINFSIFSHWDTQSGCRLCVTSLSTSQASFPCSLKEITFSLEIEKPAYTCWPRSSRAADRKGLPLALTRDNRSDARWRRDAAWVPPRTPGAQSPAQPEEPGGARPTGTRSPFWEI